MKASKSLGVLRKIYSEPHGITVVKGNWKTGKTDFTLHLFETLKDMGLVNEAAGNIQVFSDPECKHKSNDLIRYIDNFKHLKAWMFRNLNRKMFFFDECMKNAPSKKAMTLLNAEWQKVIPELSKGKVHLIAITQEESMTEKIFLHRTFNIAVWEKILLPPTHPQYRKVVKVSSKLLKENYKFSNIQKTRLHFNPYLSAVWSLEPTEQSAMLENSMELKVLHLYMQGASMCKIQKKYPELKERTQVKRLMIKGLKLLFNMLDVTSDTDKQRGYTRSESSQTKSFLWMIKHYYNNV